MSTTEIQNKKSARVALVENEPEFRSAIVNELKNHSAIASLVDFPNCEQFWHSPQKTEFDLLFLDISMPGLNGLELLSMIQRYGIDVKVVILTNLASEDVIIKAIKQGAIGYLWKSELENIREVVDIILTGGAIISPNIALKIFKSFQASEISLTPGNDLTDRERQILDILISGAKCEKVAKTMNISVNTVRKHVRNIYEKLQVTNRVELINKASDLGLV